VDGVFGRDNSTVVVRFGWIQAGFGVSRWTPACGPQPRDRAGRLRSCAPFHRTRRKEVRFRFGGVIKRVTGRHFPGCTMKNLSRYYREGPTAQDAYRARIEAQRNQIELYRRIARVQGRRLSREEAAREWIERYAGTFAEANDVKP